MTQPLTETPVTCPHCGSAQVHAEKRGWSMFSGFIGSGKIFITCLKCGERFRPGETRESRERQRLEDAQESNPVGLLLLGLGLIIVFWFIFGAH